MKAIKNLFALAAVAGLAASLSGQASAQDFYKLATLGPGSSPYLVMSTFAQLVGQKLPGVTIQVNATGAATQHMIEATKDELDFFMTSPTVFEAFKTKTAMYAKIEDAPERSKLVRNVLAFPIGSYHVITNADSGITKYEDFKGKKLFLGPPGGGATVTMINLVKAVTGYEAGKDYELVRVGWEAAAQAVQDDRIDVYVNPTIAPSPVIQQIAISKKIRFIGVSDEALAKPEVKAVTDRPGGVIDNIDPKLYGANVVNTAPVRTIATIVSIATRASLADDVVFKITKAFWEAAKASHDRYPWLRNVKIEDAFRDLNAPLHPGAVKYYQELGMKIPDDLMPPKG
jgi:TRAP transporter TAXI family solute receptor